MSGRRFPFHARIAILAVLWPLLASGCASVARWNDAARLLVAVSGEQDSEPSPAPTEVRFGASGRGYRADLYLPSRQQRAALVLVHGFTSQGKADPRLRRFAHALARAGFRVLVPEIESLTRFEAGTQNTRAIRDSLDYLAKRRGPAAGLGVAAISYSVGPALLAALESREVDFMLGVGGYYDLIEAISFATTGYYRLQGEPRYREPPAAGRWLLLLGHAGQLPAQDRRLLRRIAQLKLENPQADVAFLRQGLSRDGKAAYALAANRDPRRVPELVEQLPASMQRQIDALDPSRRDLSAFEACLVLIHGEDDPMIPPSHSIALAEAVPPERATLFIVGGISHIDVQPGWRDAFSLWRATVALLKAADGC